MIATTTTTEMIMAMMVIVNVYDDGDVDDGDAFLVSWHRCIDLISLYMHAPSCLTLRFSRSKALKHLLEASWPVTSGSLSPT